MGKKILWFLLLILFLSLVLFPLKLATLTELMKPVNIEINPNRLYILDGVTVWVYSMPDCRLVTKFGKRGQGPGELVPNDEIPLQMCLLGDNIYVNSQSKILQYSEDGRLLSEKRIPFLCMQILPLGDGYAASRSGMGSNGVITLQVVLLNSQCTPVKTLTAMAEDDPSTRGKIVIPPPYIYLHRGSDALFVTGGNQRDFCIEVFNEKGILLKPIRMPYRRLDLTDNFKDELIEWLKTDHRFSSVPAEVFRRLYFLNPLPAVRNMVITKRSAVGSEGKIYIQTYARRGDLSEFFVLDINGNRLEKLYLPTACRSKVKMNHETLFTFYHNKYYYLMENPDTEEWELHIQKLDGR